MPMPVDLRLNRLAQGLDPLSDGSDWFAALSFVDKQAVLRIASACVLQAHPTDDAIAEAIAQSGLKTTYTPVVLLGAGPLPEQLAKISALPEAESNKSFRLMISLLAVADTRRRQRDCQSGCGHWWHHLDD